MRSFSNLWYWIGLAAIWSMASHWILGVPFDMLLRAKRKGGQAQADVEDLVRINTNRILYVHGVAGTWLVAGAVFIVSSLVTLGFWYDIEFAQATVLILGPMVGVGALSLRTARRIVIRGDSGEALYRRLIWHRIAVQGIGVVSIFVTAMWGMYRNMYVGPFGGF